MNKRSVLMLAVGMGLFLQLVAAAQALDTVEYQAMIEKNAITMGDKVQFLVRVAYPLTTMKPAITPPSFSQFKVLNENETIKEEESDHDRYRVLRKIWLIEPNESGHLSIASAIVTYQDPVSNLLKNGKTNIVFVEVASRVGQAKTFTPVPVAQTSGETTKINAKHPLWLWGTLAGLLGLAMTVIVVGRSSRQNGPTPEVLAQQALQQALSLAEAEDIDGYYQGLNQAVLDYLQQKFNLNAYVLPTEDILKALKKYPIDPSLLQGLEAYFKAVDQAKFGGHTPDEDELIQMHGTVDRFIQMGETFKIKKRSTPASKGKVQ